MPRTFADAVRRLAAIPLIWCLFAVPAWCAWASYGGSGPTPLQKVPHLPGLAFDQYLVDLREVAPSEEVHAVFSYSNRGKTPIEITKLQPSCGCLQPQLYKTKLRPGESSSFLLRVKTALQTPGEKQFTVTVFYKDPAPQQEEVLFKVTLPEEQVYVRPMSLSFHQIGSGRVEQEIVLTDLRKNPVSVLGVSTTLDDVNVEYVGLEREESGAHRERFKVIIEGNVPAERRFGKVVISFREQDEIREISVPIMVTGNLHEGPTRLAQPPVQGPPIR